MTTAMTAEKYIFGGAVLHEVRPYDGGKRRNKHRSRMKSPVLYGIEKNGKKHVLYKKSSNFESTEIFF